MRKHRFIKWLLIFLLAPYVLVPVYAFIHPPSTLMLADLVRLRLPKREWVPIERISPHLIAAVVTAEDSAFCDHFGFDFKAIEKSVDKALDGRRYGGASTITQQTAKNLFLWHDRSWPRKVLEAPIALWMEIVWPKQRILEVYLNIAEWGDGMYGAQAASRHYFKVDAAKLGLRQSALMAAALPNPRVRNPASPKTGQMTAAVMIERRVLRHGSSLACLE